MQQVPQDRTQVWIGMSGEFKLGPPLLPRIFEVGGIIHKALFERPLIRDASCRPNALAGQ